MYVPAPRHVATAIVLSATMQSPAVLLLARPHNPRAHCCPALTCEKPPTTIFSEGMPASISFLISSST